MSPALLYRFEDFVLDAGRRELRRAGELVAVEPQVFDLLAFLIQARHLVVSRDDLLDAVWHRRIVSDATLSSRVNSARAAIGDNGAEQRLIRTVPRRGLRFVGAVQEVHEAPAPEGDLDDPGARAGGLEGPLIAVLPFTNMSGNQEQEYFADGMAEEVITALSRCSGLSVVARNSSFIYKGTAVDVRRVGRELGVGYVLEGSVRRGGERLRIAGQLIDAASGVQLWADRFEGGLNEVFELQDRISGHVAAAIEPALQSAEISRRRDKAPDTLDAYDLLLRAHALEHEFTAESMAAALDRLDRALALDPDYAAAMASAAYCHAQRHFQGWAPQDGAHRVEGLRLAWRAVELAPNDAQVLWKAAFAIWNLAGGDRDAALELFDRSLTINPNSATALTLAGWIETMRGNEDAGRALIARARRLNPRDPRAWLLSGAMAISAVVDGDYPLAVTWAKRALAHNRRFAVALRVLAVALVRLGLRDDAAKAVRDLQRIEPGLTVSEFFRRIPVPLEAMARTYAEALRAAGLPE